MKTEHRDFGNGNQVKMWTYVHSDGEIEYGVVVERDYDDYLEYEDVPYHEARDEFYHQIKIMKEWLNAK